MLTGDTHCEIGKVHAISTHAAKTIFSAKQMVTAEL